MPETPPRPLCFMVMPFGRKPVVPPAENGVAEIDFDALWVRAFEPVIRELGYEPMRADQDVGALIVQEDASAVLFADSTQALLQARQELAKRRTSCGALWSGYQHYGDPERMARGGAR